MAMEYKTSHKAYAAWNYRQEIEDLNRASEQGWQLVRGGCFCSRFVKNPDVRSSGVSCCACSCKNSGTSRKPKLST